MCCDRSPGQGQTRPRVCPSGPCATSLYAVASPPPSGAYSMKVVSGFMPTRGETDEQMHRHYTREEDFLAEFYNLAPAAAAAVGDEWYPRADCDDAARTQQKYFLSTGQLTKLVFESATSYHDSTGFSSVVISLRSSKRLVSVKVRPKPKAKLSYVATIEVDRAP